MFDIDACAIAADISNPKEFITIAGTWSINEYISEKPIVDGSIGMNSLFAIPGYYLAEECSATSSGNLDWYLENCINNENMLEGESVFDYANRMVESVAVEESDVYYLPFLYGSNAHPLGKAAFVGLTSYNNTAHMLRALYEGVAFSHRRHIDRLLATRTKPDAVRMAGGPVQSKVWVHMFADVLGLPIEIVEAKELGALGCAMSAAVASGVYKNYQEAARHMVHISGKTFPNLEKNEIYNKKYEKYIAVSNALDTVWGQFEV